MIEILYLVIERGRWNHPRISKVAKKRPILKKPSEQALVRLSIALPDKLLEPRCVQVEVKPEHVVAPTVTATSTPAV
jgi:hypothetical protein